MKPSEQLEWALGWFTVVESARLRCGFLGACVDCALDLSDSTDRRKAKDFLQSAVGRDVYLGTWFTRRTQAQVEAAFVKAIKAAWKAEEK
jgi:hypothetical protein